MKKRISKVIIVVSLASLISSPAVAEIGGTVSQFKESGFVRVFEYQEKKHYKLKGEAEETAYQFVSPKYSSNVVEVVVDRNGKIVSETMMFAMVDRSNFVALIGFWAEASNGKIPITEAGDFIADTIKSARPKVGYFEGYKITVVPAPQKGTATVSIREGKRPKRKMDRKKIRRR